ncbi:MAG: tetratricopeptide repeat protein [Fibrobacteria bacterium]
MADLIQPRLSLLALAMLTFLSFTVQASASVSPEALGRATKAFQQGNGAYEKNDYAKAADLYRLALDEGVADSKLYFNYANAMFRLNQPGMAILYYEKARKLDPNDQDIAYNLRFVNANIIDKNPALETNALTRALFFFHSAFSINEGLWIALGLFTIICLCAVLALYAGTAFRGALVTAMVLCGAAILVLAPSVIFKIKEQETLQYGIVLKPAVEMFSGPGESFQVLTQVHEGTKFEIVETRGEWVSVKLANGKGGFVRLADLGKV